MDNHKKLMSDLNLAKDCYETKLELLGDDRLLTEIIKQFILQKTSILDETDRLRAEGLNKYEMEKRRTSRFLVSIERARARKSIEHVTKG